MGSDTLTLFAMVAVGGAIGAVSRYTVYRIVDTEFPWGVFIVNIVGCTLAAFMMFKFGDSMGPNAMSFLFVGIFGGFTTFSTFTTDTVNMVINHQMLEAALNFVLNAVLCLCGAFIGWFLSTI